MAYSRRPTVLFHVSESVDRALKGVATARGAPALVDSQTSTSRSMKAVILAGGLGTRMSEETHLKPKPMVEIGGKPILWHIMKIYSAHGVNDFVICCGYKGYVIKEYFANYFLHMSDVTFDMADNRWRCTSNRPSRGG